MLPTEVLCFANTSDIWFIGTFFKYILFNEYMNDLFHIGIAHSGIYNTTEVFDYYTDIL